jgi:hypothetical protein
MLNCSETSTKSTKSTKSTALDITDVIYNLISLHPGQTTEYYTKITNLSTHKFESMIKNINNHPNTFYPYQPILKIKNTWVIDDNKSKMLLHQKIIELERVIEEMQIEKEKILMQHEDRNF